MNRNHNFRKHKSMINRIEELKKSNSTSDELVNLTHSKRMIESTITMRRSPQYIENSKWAKEFKNVSFSLYGEALRLLKDSNYEVRIIKNDECAEQFNVDFMYAITPIKNDGFWLDSKFSPDDCHELCDIMGWEVIE